MFLGSHSFCANLTHFGVVSHSSEAADLDSQPSCNRLQSSYHAGVQLHLANNANVNFVAEIPLGSGVVSAFVNPSAAIAQALSSTFVATKVMTTQYQLRYSESQPGLQRLPGVRLPFEHDQK